MIKIIKSFISLIAAKLSKVFGCPETFLQKGFWSPKASSNLAGCSRHPLHFIPKTALGFGSVFAYVRPSHSGFAGRSGEDRHACQRRSNTMKKLFRKKERMNTYNMLKPIDVSFDRMDAYILKKYGLVDIEKKDIFILLNILFMIIGVISIVSFLYKIVNVIAVAGGVITVIISFVIFGMVKKYGKKIEKKEETEK